MCLEGLRELKERIDGLEGIRRMASTMKMVAVTRFRRAQEEACAVQEYFDGLNRMALWLGNLTREGAGAHLDGEPRPRRAARPTPALYLVLAGDRGLSGPYNHNILKQAEHHLAQHQRVSIFAAGRKAIEFLEHRGYPMEARYTDLPEHIDRSFTASVAGDIINHLEQEGMEAFYIVYTQFMNIVRQDVRILRPYPLPAPREREDARQGEGGAPGPVRGDGGEEGPLLPDRMTTGNEDPDRIRPGDGVRGPAPEGTGQVIVEPHLEGLQDDFLPFYITGTVHGAFRQARVSEYAARMQAMDAAAENAREMVDELTVRYNRMRKEEITTEITEIVSGAQALT